MENQVFAVTEGRLLRFEASGTAAEEFLPSPPGRIFAASGLLFADTPNGLYRKSHEGWTLARHRASGLPPGPSHITALGSLGGRLIVGLFDGGLVAGSPQADSLVFSAVPGSATWGVNALMPSGGVLYVASLRGTARFDGNRIEAMSSAGTGGSYALASASEGVVIGTGQGVLLADGRFLSAFHGLPGNQALALATKGEDLFVGTPSGLGAVRNAKVSWRVETGDGRLPHPWITALAFHRNELFVGTYGGGVTRRTTLTQQESAMGVFNAFPETQGLKVNTGCLVIAGGRLFLGTEGKGLHVLNSDGSRFIHLDLPLPSPRVTALFGEGDWLYVGTDEGLTRLSLSTLREGA
jgi:ligand-binding sensor domain-containing protein